MSFPARIDVTTTFWVVTDPGPDSAIEDILFATTLEGLRLQFAGGLTTAEHPTIHESEEFAREDAMNRLIVWKVARDLRRARDLPVDETIRVTLRGQDGRVLFEGEVR